jgi:hypothetical protein
MDRKIILAAAILIISFIGVAFDPLGLSGKKSTTISAPNVDSTTGLFSVSNIYISVLPGIFFLVLIMLAYYVAKDQAGKD